MEFALMYINDFPHIQQKLDLYNDEFGVYYFIYDQVNDKYYKYNEKPVMVNEEQMDSNAILDYTINFVHKKNSPYRRSEANSRRV